MRKTHLWISLLAGLAVWGAYFAHVIGAVRGGDTNGLAWWFLGALAMVVLIEVAVGGLIAWLFRRRARTLDDGPTLSAALKASHIALMILIVLALMSAAGLALSAAFGWSLDLSTARGQVIAANVLLGMVVVAEMARAAFTLALLPRR